MFYSFIFCMQFYSYLDLLFIIVFICFLIIFFFAENFNINYLHNPNIVAVRLSFVFNVVIHFINYLCLNWLILVFSGFITLFIYVLRVCVRLRVTIRKSFLKNNSKIIFLFVCLYYLCFSKLDEVL